MRVDEPSPTLFLWAVDVGPWAAQPSVESAGGMEFLPRWTAEGCAPAATSTTWPLCGASPDGYWCRFEKQGHHTSFISSVANHLIIMSASFSPSGSSMRCTKPDCKPFTLSGHSSPFFGCLPNECECARSSARLLCQGYKTYRSVLGTVTNTFRG